MNGVSMSEHFPHLLYIPLVAPPTFHLACSVRLAGGAACSLRHTGSGLWSRPGSALGRCPSAGRVPRQGEPHR